MGRRRGSSADANTPVPVKFGLSPVAHIIVSTAASMKGVSLAEYVREAVIERAKIDAAEFNKLMGQLSREGESAKSNFETTANISNSH